jgi:CheY-like chemotaxis protein
VRIARIVKAMRDFADKGHNISKTSVPLNQAIEDTIALCRNEWKLIAEIEIHLDPSLPTVPGYPTEIKRCLMNLIVNAAEALGDRNPCGGTKGRIRVTSRHTATEAIITVNDDGPGIPESIRDRIFEPFFTTKEIGFGLGQGLSFVYSAVVNRHGGRLTVESSEDRGTTFTIRLPLGEGLDSKKLPMVDGIQKDRMSRKVEQYEASLLLVDDSVYVLDGLRRMLSEKEETWRMQFVGSGQEALNLMVRDHFDLVITDLQMPEMTGIELLHQVAALYPEAGGYVLTGEPSPNDIAELQRLGYGVIAKPCDAETLRSAIQEALNKIPRRRPLKDEAIPSA